MKEHPAADLAEKHGLLEADHCASRRTERGHSVVCMLSLPPFLHGGLHLAGPFWRREEAVQLVVCGVLWPVQMEESEQNLGHTRWYGPQVSKSVLSTRDVNWSFVKSVSGWRQSCESSGGRLPGKKSTQK